MIRKPKLWTPREWPEAVPSYVTPRNPDRDTIGPSLIETSRKLGFEPMPWSIDAYMTFGEIDERGRLFYSEGRASTPRQQSKTTGLTFVRQVDRMLHAEERGWPDEQNAAFTMQHASDARAKMTRLWQPRVEKAAFPEWIRNLRGSGTESIEWLNGRMIPFAPNGVSIHGDVLDDVSLDEAWAFHEDGRAEAGCRPAMITRASSQLLISSTAGTNESLYWMGKCEDGRARVEAGDDGRVYFLEYAADLTRDDIHNPEHFPRWMPALGYTITLDAVLLEHDTIDPEQWLRSYCNIQTGSMLQVIPAAAWAAAYAEPSTNTGKVWMSVDVAPGAGGVGRAAAISVATWVGTEIHTWVLDSAAGLSWVADTIGTRTRERTVQVLYIDATGPIGSILPDIKAKAACNIEVIDASTMAAASERFLNGITDGTIKHRDQDVLNAAVAGAAKRVLNDGWALKRRTSTANIAPLVGVVLASWGAATHPLQAFPKMYTRA